MSDSNNQPKQEQQSPVAEVNEWITQVVESLVGAQKQLVELAAEQNAIVFKTIQEFEKIYTAAPSTDLGKWGLQGLETFLENQRKWAESAAKQGIPFINISSKQQTEDTTNVTGTLKAQVQTAIEARNRWLDFLSEENTRFLNTLKDNSGVSDASQTNIFTDWARQAIDGYVENQKRWLNLITQFPGTSGGSN